ncbi:S-adenosyl-L-methionine-dependent methyltransferases superfamily protein [Prunus dulcis]|uniref:S-adenosyl-L-methionine-dependent methyltransferases superfamily protein n=1 Tax=Prunus dulcis TaxID=3755 RepID=A0A4Y1QNC1_PRUDU|nr:S-adenosyl-L-methionine-dependent methyltransferases superfamily protein [Prunus dulcis]
MGNDNAFEWYEDWSELQAPLLSHLPNPTTPNTRAGCGTSHLSEHLYDVGFKAITNIDLSEIAISDMLCRNACQRPGMKWQVMDITTMQFEDESFDVVVDKGGLDALMEPETNKFTIANGTKVNRVLKCGGKFICFSWAWSDVLGTQSLKLELPVCFSLHAIPLKLITKPNNLQTFMVVAGKDQMPTAILHQITTSSSLNTTYGNQACRLQLEALGK